MDVEISTRRVEDVKAEFAVVLRLSGGAEIRIETPFELALPGRASIVIDPRDVDTDERLKDALLGQTVVTAVAGAEDGSLGIAFHSGATVALGPDPTFESWSIVWPDGDMIVSLPGGGLSRWGSR